MTAAACRSRPPEGEARRQPTAPTQWPRTPTRRAGRTRIAHGRATIAASAAARELLRWAASPPARPHGGTADTTSVPKRSGDCTPDEGGVAGVANPQPTIDDSKRVVAASDSDHLAGAPLAMKHPGAPRVQRSWPDIDLTTTGVARAADVSSTALCGDRGEARRQGVKGGTRCGVLRLQRGVRPGGASSKVSPLASRWSGYRSENNVHPRCLVWLFYSFASRKLGTGYG